MFQLPYMHCRQGVARCVKVYGPLVIHAVSVSLSALDDTKPLCTCVGACTVRYRASYGAPPLLAGNQYMVLCIPLCGSINMTKVIVDTMNTYRNL